MPNGDNLKDLSDELAECLADKENDDRIIDELQTYVKKLKSQVNNIKEMYDAVIQSNITACNKLETQINKQKEMIEDRDINYHDMRAKFLRILEELI